MKDRVQAAFDLVWTDPALKSKTLDTLRQKIRRSSPARQWIPAVVCLLVLAIGLTGTGAYFTPAAAIYIDSGSGVTLTVNPFDRVIGATALNQKEATALAGLRLHNTHYLDAVSAVLECRNAQSDAVSITVSCDNIARCQTITDAVSAKTACYGNVSCSSDHGSRQSATQYPYHHGTVLPQVQTPASSSPDVAASPTPLQNEHHNRRRHHGG